MRKHGLDALRHLLQWSFVGETREHLRSVPVGYNGVQRMVMAFAQAKANASIFGVFGAMQQAGLIVGGAADNGLVVPQLQAAMNRRAHHQGW